jgi:hypothetical protein
VVLPAWSLAKLDASPPARTLALAGTLGAVLLFAAVMALPASPSAEQDLAAIERIWEPKR